MSSANHDLKARIQGLPKEPGVYLMKNAQGKIIYIGKAINLRGRVGGYFNAREAENHLASIILKHKAREIDYIVTSNEKEALILEANLVKRHRPRYNIMLKDDKHFPYIRLTLSEPFPRLLVTRKTSGGKDAYFGPYTDVRAMRRTIQFLQKTFRIRDCNLKLPLQEPIKPCLTYHIGRCDAPCADMCAQKDYGILALEVKQLLGGKTSELLRGLSSQMEGLARDQQFEAAAKIRDQIKNIQSMQESQRMDLGTNSIPKDLLAVARSGTLAAAVILSIREGLVMDKKTFKLSCQREQTLSEIITEFLKSFYLSGQDIPREIILSHPLDPNENMEALLTELRSGPVQCLVPERGDKKRQIDLAKLNAEKLCIDYIGQYEKSEREIFALKSLQEELVLPTVPRIIEGFDISHLGGTDTVASQVVFVGGKPKKSLYRKYNVKTVKGIDDFKSMEEVFRRRVSHLVREKKPFPDLFLIDGGKGQLGMAYSVLAEFGLNQQPIIGLAKRLEEVFKPGQSDPYRLPPSSPGLKLLQNVRDESHRFAITFQKSKRNKYLTKSWLDEIPGIGPKTKIKLLQYFGTPAKVKQSNQLEFEKILGKNLGAKIYNSIHVKMAY